MTPLTDRDRLLIFTRYPQPGKAKTRLIPALGPVKAADLQRQMTEHTLAQVQLLTATQPLSVEIWYAGTEAETETSDRDQMQTWLGTQWSYQLQRGADLGERLIQAIQTAFDQGMQRVVTIGTDCPGLDAARLQQALQRLDHHDLVLGPATDGGYYLIGLRRFLPELFVDMPWGSETVLQQTLAAAEKLGLTIAALDPLTDVDRPADLWVWEAAQSARLESGTTEKKKTLAAEWCLSRPQPLSQPPLLSVIIPVLNEAALIESILYPLQAAPVEVIVVDGGSHDQTVERAKALGVKVIQTAAGRATQMNAGAKIATGEVLLFLHGDTILPEQFVSCVQDTLAQPDTIAGAFDLAIAGDQPGLRWIEWAVKWRSRLWQLPYGDQALFLKAKTFHQLGGFAELPIMEDFELVRRLQAYGTIAIAPAAVVTSGRRWQQLGILRTTLLNQIVIMAYCLGVPPSRIAHWYRRGIWKRQQLG
jgi:uncharacterized protein